jgi:hypothetical protein
MSYTLSRQRLAVRPESGVRRQVEACGNERPGSEHARHATRALQGFAVLCLAGLVLAGCSRRVPIGEIGTSGTAVWTRIVTEDGERLRGRLVSLDASEIVIEIAYPIEGDVRLSTRAGKTELYSGPERVEGELVGVIEGDEGREALVHRRCRTIDVESASFYESKGEQSLRTIVSLFLGPAVGGLAGLIF